MKYKMEYDGFPLKACLFAHCVDQIVATEISKKLKNMGFCLPSSYPTSLTNTFQVFVWQEEVKVWLRRDSPPQKKESAVNLSEWPQNNNCLRL